MAEDTGNNPNQPMMANNMQERLASAKKITDKENQQHQSNLTQSKGRAQVTATTAMSIVNVALLKSVLDRGPDDNRYYEASLILISISLGLQIIAGIMSLMIEQAHGYMTKYGGNFCEDMEDYCCMFRCIRNKRRSGHDKEQEHEHIYPTGETSSKGTEHVAPWEQVSCDLESGIVLADASEDPLCECCPFVITNKIYAHYEISTLEKFNKWRLNFVNNELKMIKNEEELIYQVNVVANSKERLAMLAEIMKKPDADKAEIERQVQQLNAQLTAAQERKNRYENTLRQADIVREQGLMLKEYAGAIKKNRLLKLTSFWQQILNYLFYAIFIINAFITGFGLGTSPVPRSEAVLADNATQQM